jgi:hypothetical protein
MVDINKTFQDLWATGKKPEWPDEGDPVFLVRTQEDARQLFYNLRFAERYEAGAFSTWYYRNAINLASPEDCKVLLAADLKNAVGSLSWKPHVLLFQDNKLVEKLLGHGLTVSVLDKIPETLEQFRAGVQFASPALKPGLQDMPTEVLDGWLGEICRTRMADFPIAFAWPALVTVAGSLVPGTARTNLYLSLVAAPGAGKTSAIEYAIKLLGLEAPTLLRMKSGSAEGLAKLIGNVGGAHRLFFPDELLHTLKKANIEGATFSSFLNTAYNFDWQQMTIARGEQLNFNAQLSFIGGLVTEEFGDGFGDQTTGGLYDRFIFGIEPSDFQYFYKDFEGGSALQSSSEESIEPNRPIPVSIDPKVLEMQKDYPKLKRVFQHAVRVAAICAAFDGRPVLLPGAMGPALAFAEYQLRVREILKPNPGHNPEGILLHKFLAYLDRVAPDNRAVGEREMLNATNAGDFGPNVAERTLQGLSFNGTVERIKVGRKKYVRKLD